MKVLHDLNGKFIIEELNKPVVITSENGESSISISPHGLGFELKFNKTYYYALKNEGIVPVNTEKVEPRFVFESCMSLSSEKRIVYSTGKGKLFSFDIYSNRVFEGDSEDEIKDIDKQFDLQKARAYFNSKYPAFSKKEV